MADAWSSDGGKGGLEIELSYNAHPLGVRPRGNALAAHKTFLPNMGVLGGLPDETILMLLEWLDSKSLLNLGASCRALYAYTTSDQLWKDLFILYANLLISCSFVPTPSFPLVACALISQLHAMQTWLSIMLR